MSHKLTQAQKNARARQRRRDKQYRDMITNFKNIYNELQLGAVAGKYAPSAEDILKSRGISSGLKKPTKKTIERLRTLQNRASVMSAAAMSIKSNRKEAKEAEWEIRKRAIFEWEKEKKRKKRAKDKANKPPTNPPKKRDEKGQEKPDKPTPPPPPLPAETAAIETVVEQIERIKDRVESSKHYTNADITVLACAEDLLDKINFILGLGTDEQIEMLNDGAIKYFQTQRQVEYQELYEDAPNLRPCLFTEVRKTLSPNEQNLWASDSIWDNADYFQ